MFSSPLIVFQRIRVHAKCSCSRAGYVYREGEGSTGPSRGEHRLTVYRAHASFKRAKMTRKSFLSSESTTGAGEIEIEWASQKIV